MNILSQNFINALKINLNNVISNNLDKLLTDISNIFDNTKVDSIYTNFINTMDIYKTNIVLNTIKNTIETFDSTYKKSLERKNKYYISKSNVPRTIVTIFGVLTYYRTYYKSKKDNSYHFLIDEKLGFPKYEKYDQIVKAYAINNAFKTSQKISSEITTEYLSSFSSILNGNPNIVIPRQSIHNWINKWNVPDIEYPERDTPNCLYIMVDEKYIGCQDLDKDIMVKSFVSFEGIEIKGSRRILKNRLIYNTCNKHAWEEYCDFLYKIYDTEKLNKIYLMSDGGNWIKSGIAELKHSPNQEIKRLLCEFHFKQSINRITTNSDERKILNLIFKEDNKKEFLKTKEEMILNYPTRIDKIIKNYDYISNNYTAIKDMIEHEIGSSMEAHISHIVAYLYSSRPKGYSSNKIDKYLKISNYMYNGINIMRSYLFTHKDESPVHIHEQQLSFSLFESIPGCLPVLHSLPDNRLTYIINELKTANTI